MKKLLFAVVVVGLIFYLKSESFQLRTPSFISDAVNQIPSASNILFHIPSSDELIKFFSNNLLNLTGRFKLGAPSSTTLIIPHDAGSLLEPLQKIKDQVIAPPPIEQPPTQATTTLSRMGVIHRTNTERILQNLSPLKENDMLDRAAQIKANDLFARQYFAHISPSGQGVATVVTAEGYQYAIVGENLALGRFDDDTALVGAWMASLGHRENILNPRYEEIGAAVTKGIFQGLETWVAVQVFALPLESCPGPDINSRATIDAKKALLDELQAKANALKQEIAALSHSDPAHESKVNEYNSMVPQINAAIDDLDGLIKRYNEQVQLLNGCISLRVLHRT